MQREEDPVQSDSSGNILFIICHLIEESPLKWEGKWVKGHQDDGDQSLDAWAIDNIEVDRVAGEFWLKSIQYLILEDQGY